MIHTIYQTIPEVRNSRAERVTGWSISILYTLSGLYDNNNKCMKKIIVDIHSAYMEISSKIANLDIYKHLQSKI